MGSEPLSQQWASFFPYHDYVYTIINKENRGLTEAKEDQGKIFPVFPLSHLIKTSWNDMLLRTLRSKKLCCRSVATDGRQTRIFLVLLGILVVSAFIAAGAQAGSEISLQKKGHQTMPQAAAAFKKDLPPLDAVQPARIETFTFGLG
jgi:hypothetical protein